MSAAQHGGILTIALDIGGDVLRFPLWWYSEGLRRTIVSIFDGVRGYARKLGVMVWLKNIFTPMFGRYDWQSRLISVFMRAVNVFGRGFVLSAIALMGVVFGVVYLVLPVLAAVFSLYHLSAFFGI